MKILMIVLAGIVLFIILGWIVDPEDMNAIWSGMVNTRYPQR